MNPQPEYSDELDVLEHDIRLLRVLVDAAVQREDADMTRALSKVIDDRKARLGRAMRDAAAVSRSEEFVETG